MLQCNGRAPLT